MNLDFVHLAECGSTQEHARSRAQAAPGSIVAVLADAQLTGRGRNDRVWHDPPGASLLLSVALVAPMQVPILDELPRWVADQLLHCIQEQIADGGGSLVWKSPNDLVDVDGAKAAGILIDARTVGAVVEQVVIGVGVNLSGGRFVLADGRRATCLETVYGGAVDRITLAHALTARLARRLGAAIT